MMMRYSVLMVHTRQMGLDNTDTNHCICTNLLLYISLYSIDASIALYTTESTPMHNLLEIENL